MKSQITSKLTILAAGFASVQLASASTTIFTDTFASGTGDWYKADTSIATTLSNASGQLSFATGSATNMSDAIGRAFTETILTVGQTLRLSFDYRQGDASAAVLRLGLFNLGGRTATVDDWSGAAAPAGSFAGYYGFVRDNNGAGSALREEANNFNGTNNNIGPMMATTSTFTSYLPFDNTIFDIVDDGTVTYQVVFDITRSATNIVDLAYKFSSGGSDHFSLSATDTTTPYSTFDTIVIRPDAGTMFLDNVQLSVIPEPSTALLGALGAMCLLRRRR